MLFLAWGCVQNPTGISYNNAIFVPKKHKDVDISLAIFVPYLDYPLRCTCDKNIWYKCVPLDVINWSIMSLLYFMLENIPLIEMPMKSISII